MDFGLGDFDLPTQEIEIATLMRLGNAVRVESHITAPIARLRLYPRFRVIKRHRPHPQVRPPQPLLPLRTAG